MPRGKEGQVKQLEHFCRVFQKTLREYAVIETRNYASKDELKKMSVAWATSAHEEAVESRKVFTEELRQKYDRPEWHKWNGSLANEYQKIESWSHCAEEPDVWTEARDKKRRALTDIIKVLFMEGSFVTQPLPNRQRGLEERQHIETLLLLAHRPSIALHDLAHLGEACCNTSCGVSNLAEKAIKAYIYLNVLFAMREDGSDVCSDTMDNTRPDVNEINWCYAKKQWTTPRAKYMNTTSWGRLMYELTRNHENHPEISMYEPFFFPARGSELKSTEADIMVDAEVIREFVRDLWKLMVNYEVVWREMGQEVNWEYMCVKALDDMYSCGKGENRLFGMYTHQWKDDRDARV